LVALVRDCASLEVEADGLTFLANSAVAEEITRDSEYKGTRILMDARMDNVRLKIQIDVGVGDVMVRDQESGNLQQQHYRRYHEYGQLEFRDGERRLRATKRWLCLQPHSTVIVKVWVLIAPAGFV
jgi:hypothetical protein